MSNKTVVRARIGSETKEQAAQALAEMGLSVSDYIRMTLIRVVHDKAVPFKVKIPNAVTAETMRKSELGEDIQTANDADELFEQLGI